MQNILVVFIHCNPWTGNITSWLYNDRKVLYNKEKSTHMISVEKWKKKKNTFTSERRSTTAEMIMNVW